PSTWIQTPSGSLRTQPARRSMHARRYTNGRKPTPCTTPRTRKRAAVSSAVRMSPRSADKEVVPLLEPHAGPNGILKHCRLRRDAADVCKRRFPLERGGIRHVNLADQDDVGILENNRILERLIFPFGDRKQHDANVFS